jgi:hypothetical protein
MNLGAQSAANEQKATKQYILKEESSDDFNPYEEIKTRSGILSREDAFRLLQEENVSENVKQELLEALVV